MEKWRDSLRSFPPTLAIDTFRNRNQFEEKI